ncbi:PEP-CTERM sorting domain-containing protein [Okeania sp.]|uniref:PEP-CTERM sorting domain-containing protein n=1 Tax=Okeania sp. TaxID=3100323 RepID=UPI002B4B2F3A|nr:PEP-CTERM sorting domain-containing protein [Okeania sp.]MEB3342090.1 PEP-CTERM sorting domain-containing protein [Okeania sp.]
MKTTKLTSPLSKAAIFAKTALLATVALTGNVTFAEAASFTKLDFDTDYHGNTLEAGTIVNGGQFNNSDGDRGTNPWFHQGKGVKVRRRGSNSDKGLTLFNSSCEPNANNYSGYNGFTNDCTGGDTDLATGGNLNTRARGNVLIAQDSGRQGITDGKFSDPGDQGNGSKIEFIFDEGVALGNIEFLDFDKTDANKIKLKAKGENNTILADYTFSRSTGEVTDNLTGQVFSNAVNKINEDVAFTGEELTGNAYVTYFLANQDVVPHKYENSVWDFYFNKELEGVRKLEVDFNGISGAISELSYAKLYEDFTHKPTERVPEPGSIAALAFIGGGMFLSRRRQSN